MIINEDIDVYGYVNYIDDESIIVRTEIENEDVEIEISINKIDFELELGMFVNIKTHESELKIVPYKYKITKEQFEIAQQKAQELLDGLNII